MRKDIDVLCVGLAVSDVFGKAIDDVPELGRLQTFDHIEHHIGGCAVNTGVDLARLGAKVACVGCVGSDAAGDFLRKRLDAEGVDTSGIVTRDSIATAYTFIMIDSKGNRRYLHHVGANASLSDSDVPDALLARARLLHIGGSFLMPGLDGLPTARLLKRAKALGVTTSLDTAFNKAVDARALIEPSLPVLDIFLPSIEEAELISGTRGYESSLASFDACRIPICGIKLGARGCVIKHNGHTRLLPSFPVTVIDTSGAGDSFVAGFLYGHLQGWPVETCATFANAVAAHCVQAIGCSSGIPAAAAVLNFLETVK